MAAQIDPFLLRERINRAGMGMVWRAQQDTLVDATPVHLLDPDPTAIPERLRHVREDAHRTANAHPAAVIDVDGRPIVVMERVDGATLAQVSRGGLPRTRALDIVDQLLGALAALHDAGMVHADIQPASVMVDGTVVSLVDFGGEDDLAGLKATEYLAPEVIAGGKPSVASDIYAVGVVLFELLSGELPFKGGSPIEIMQRQLRGAAPPLSLTRLGRHLPSQLERVCARALARDPSRRFRDARSFAAALRDAMQPVSAAVASSEPHVSLDRLRERLVAAIAELVGVTIVKRTLDLALALERHGRHGEAIDRIEDTIELLMWDERIAGDDLQALDHLLHLALARLHERARDQGRARQPPGA